MKIFLKAEDVKRHLTMSRAIELMRDAFAAISLGQAVIPVRQNLVIENFSGNFLTMPCYLPGSGYYGIKIVNVFSDNVKKKLPTIQSIYHLFDEKNGTLLISMDGAMLTKIRTAAASGLATQLLAKNEASVLAVFGAGIQAESHIEAICHVNKINEIIIFALQKENAQALMDKANIPYSANFSIAESDEQLQKADIICTTTPSTDPLFKKENLKTSVHINAIGSYKPEMIEIPLDVVAGSVIIVDQYEGAFHEAGEIIQAIQNKMIKKDDIFCELGEIVLKKKLPPAGSNHYTLFKSVGNALQDLVCARYLYETLK